MPVPDEAEPVEGDAFGRMLLDVHNGIVPASQAYERAERDNGSVFTSNACQYFRSPDAWSPISRTAVSQARGRVLDIGVGAGQHAIEAQNSGCTTTGLDVSEGALEVARLRGVEKVVHGSVSEAAARFEPATFDTFLMLGHNLVLLGAPDSARSILSSLRRIAAPEAKLIGTGVDPEHMRKMNADYVRDNEQRGRTPGHFRIRIRYRHLATDWSDYAYYSPEDLMTMAQQHGWNNAGVERHGSSYVAVLRLA